MTRSQIMMADMLAKGQISGPMDVIDPALRKHSEELHKLYPKQTFQDCLDALIVNRGDFDNTCDVLARNESYSESETETGSMSGLDSDSGSSSDSAFEASRENPWRDRNPGQALKLRIRSSAAKTPVPVRVSTVLRPPSERIRKLSKNKSFGLCGESSKPRPEPESRPAKKRKQADDFSLQQNKDGTPVRTNFTDTALRV